MDDLYRKPNKDDLDHFLTQIFALSRFNKVIESNQMKALVEYHTHNKYLLMAYHQKKQKVLGKIVANHMNHETKVVIQDYYQVLKESLEKPLSRGRNINMLMHLFGYFKKDLSRDEKAEFLDVLEQYSSREITFKVPLEMIYEWVIRFEQTYLMEQTIFNPYPKNIREDLAKSL